jgi:hypothetical protein
LPIGRNPLNRGNQWRNRKTRAPVQGQTEFGIITMLGRCTRMKTSTRLLLSWLFLIAGFALLALGFVGGWYFSISLLAFLLLRYGLKPRITARPLWFTFGIVLLVLALVFVPAWREWPASFADVFRSFQWLGASFMLVYALIEHLQFVRRRGVTNAA